MKLKKTIVSRFVTDYTLNTEIINTYKMQAGDLAVFEIIELGKHETAQMVDGKNRSIFPGDHLLAAFADRYATSQYEGYVPEGPRELYDILGAGGAIGVVKTKNYSLKDIEPTTVKLIGYCCDETGNVINTKFYNTKRSTFRGDVKPKVILSIGSTMDSGKTTTAAFTSRGLAMGGHKVGFIKLTGTCYTRDREFVLDCGANIVTDFSDMGFPSTFMCSKEDILDIYQSLIDSLAGENLEYIVMEIADGLMQRETMFLLQDKAFMSTIDKVIFSCGDSLSAFYGVQLLKEWDIEVTAISGRFTMSPLLINEVHDHIRIPVFTIDEVMTGAKNELFGAKVVA
jgi:hypothetical protein